MVASGQKMHIWCTYGIARGMAVPERTDREADEMASTDEKSPRMRGLRALSASGARSFHRPSRTPRSRASRSSSPPGAPSGACSSSRRASIPPPASAGAAACAYELGDAFADVARRRPHGGAGGQGAQSGRAMTRTAKRWPPEPLRWPSARFCRTTVSETLDAYEKAVMARREPNEATRRQAVDYARKAVRLMRAEALAPRGSTSARSV